MIASLFLSLSLSLWLIWDEMYADIQFSLKEVSFFSRNVVIICQNENGPCPLLALANGLLLENKISIHPDRTVISLTDLQAMVADYLLESLGSVNAAAEEETLQRQQQLDDVLKLLPSLSTGLNLNVKFFGVSEFESTQELAVFDALAMPLFHGWVVDPRDEPTAAALGKLSYNQVVEKLVSSPDSSSTSEHTILLENFLASTPAQLTEEGLSQLYERVRERQVAVFFRNNHFATLYRFEAVLYLLVTDVGYAKMPQVVWEKLDSITGCVLPSSIFSIAYFSYVDSLSLFLFLFVQRF